jgi:hypothetical protein
MEHPVCRAPYSRAGNLGLPFNDAGMGQLRRESERGKAFRAFRTVLLRRASAGM